MTPTPKHENGYNGDQSQFEADGEDICVTGVSGTFPDAESVHELREALFNKVDLISEDDRRWKLKHPEIPKRFGKVRQVNKFDSAFFGVHHKLAKLMDPMGRMLMEKAYEAIYDAGVNPKTLRNSNTGVFVGVSFSETERTFFYEKLHISGFGLTGATRSMMANRLSYCFGLNGPSYVVDSACSSALHALHCAVDSIRSGKCDAAIVGGANLCLHPYITLQFSRLGVLSKDGFCRPFDKNASGYTRSESVMAIFLQKAKDSKRVYTRIIHSKLNNDGFKEEGITFPSSEGQLKLFKQFYSEVKADPHDLEYIEAHGTGTAAGDPVEMKSIDDAFCVGRSRPLLIGSVKSNVGHTEAASGLVSMIKMCIAYDTGCIPPNLHYTSPHEALTPIVEGRLKVVDETTPWNCKLSGVNSFGFGGSNSHVLLDTFVRPKVNQGKPKDDLPRLICISGRTESAVNKILDDAQSRPVDQEYIGLLHGIHEFPIDGHVYRGYSVLRSNEEPICSIREVQYYPGVKRPIWFVFSGMGSQWTGSGRHLMKLPTFAAAIEKCHKVLEPEGVDLKWILTDPDPTIYDNILNSFLAITATQIALFEVIKEIGIEPDNIIGHSLGEVACSYADGCFTLEQAILASYYRGVVSVETTFIKGSMAAIGLGSAAAKCLCPSDIVVACHNGPDSCTISGPQDSVKTFVGQMQSRGVFAKEVRTNNIAYHSKYIDESGPALLKFLKKTVPNPKKRSQKWLSTSLLEKDWTTMGEYCSAEYHTRNLLNPVFFEETSRKIPHNAITIEFSPQGLMRSILNRSLDKNCTNIALTKKNAPDGLEYLLSSIGKLYEEGITAKISNLYPKVSYPVSKSTPMLSHLVEWDHTTDWYVASYINMEKLTSGERQVNFTIKDEIIEFMAGHNIDGRILYPATGYILLVWETVSLMSGKFFSETPVVIEDLRLHRATNIPAEGSVEFNIMVHKGTGRFEVSENGNPVVTGTITIKYDMSKEFRPLPVPEDSDPDKRKLTTKDIYKEMKLRGYNYTGPFRSILWGNMKGTAGSVQWIENWVTFMDSMLQFKIIDFDSRSLYVPTRVSRIVIDVERHLKCLQNQDETVKSNLDLNYWKEIDTIRCGGIEIKGIHGTAISRRRILGEPVLEKYEFVPNIIQETININDAVRIDVHTMLENSKVSTLKAVEFLDSESKREQKPLMPLIRDVLDDLPLIQTDLSVVSEYEFEVGPAIEVKQSIEDVNYIIVIGTDLLKDPERLDEMLSLLKENGFVISRESVNSRIEEFYEKIDIINTIKISSVEKLVLLRKIITPRKIRYIVLENSLESFDFVDKVKAELNHINKESLNEKLVVVAQGDRTNGILGFVKCLRKEIGNDAVSCVFIIDPKAPKFNPDLQFYQSQLDKDLGINIFMNGKWGSYRHTKLKELANVLTEHAYYNITTVGDLSSLRWVEGPIKVNNSKNLVHVYFSSLNYRDVVTASGRVAKDAVATGRTELECVQGLEYSGRTSNGSRVMGILPCKAIANVVEADEYLTIPVPDSWTLEDAATVPIAYFTVFYSLCKAITMRPKESILIHGALGGVGQACINFCLFKGYEIFATVGSPERKEMLKKIFPEIPDDHIASSRDVSFEEMIMLKTKGRGVDVVLNSLSDDKLQASLRCLAPQGRFIELGKADIYNDTPIGMNSLFKETSIHSIFMYFSTLKPEHKMEIRNMIIDGIQTGAVKPLCRKVYEIEEAEKAFRFLASSKHVGKVMIKIRDEESELKKLPQVLLLKARPRYQFYPDDSYVIVGGLGGFGLELIDWMVTNGARNIIASSTRGISNGYQAWRIRAWENYGARIVINKDDASTQDGCRSLLKQANRIAPVRGIYNLAVILKDALFENQTAESFKAAFKPKVLVTKWLDIESRKCCPKLTQFVVFSSVVCGRGNAGQTNYGMANAVMEHICEVRKSDGLPALAIEWGAIGEVGIVADMQDDQVDMEISGTLQQRISSCLEVLSQFLNQRDHVILSSIVVAEKKHSGTDGQSVMEAIANVMNIKDITMVSKQTTIAELGMDSIMAVEIKQCLERDFDLYMTPTEIRTLTFSRLEELSEKHNKVVTVVQDSGKAYGLNLLFKNVGTEEDASEEMVNMVTLSNEGLDCDNVFGGLEVESTMYLIPGVEGMSNVFESLSKRLKCKAITLQLGLYTNETVQDTAKRLFKRMKQRLDKDEKFMLLGYSYGTLIALEIARMLEADGYTGNVFLVDGSPTFLMSLIKSAFGEINESLMQDFLLNHTFKIMQPKQKRNVMFELSKCEAWDEKCAAIASYVMDFETYSVEYLKAVCNAIYRRMTNIINYKPDDSVKLRSNVVLLRVKELVSEDLDDVYDLQRFVEKPVQVYKLDSYHNNILENKVCPNIINRFIIEDVNVKK